MIKKILFAVILVSYPWSGGAATYWQRFAKFADYTPAQHGESAKSLMRHVKRLAARHPWLLELPQPTAKPSFTEGWHHTERRMRSKGLPTRFYSTRRTIISYNDDLIVNHIYVAKETPNYAIFQKRVGPVMPVVVTVGDNQGKLSGEYLYIERPLPHMMNIFRDSGFSFEDFIAGVQSPVLNIASGGYRFSTYLRRLDNKRQNNIPYPQRRQLDAFSLDISGALRTLQSNPWYLFGDMRATGLPSNTFGAVIALGGSLKKVTIPIRACIEILREMERIAMPNGTLLIEYAMPTYKFIDTLNSSAMDYVDYKIYESTEYSHATPDRAIKLIEITLDKAPALD